MSRAGALMVDALIQRVLDALWETQWTVRWKGRSLICAYWCDRRPARANQETHYQGCEFIQLWNDLASERVHVGDDRVPTVASPKSGIIEK